MRKSTEIRTKGAVRQTTGRIKQEAGRITRNRSMQAEGFLEKNVGKAQGALGRSRKKREDRKSVGSRRSSRY